MADKSSHTKVFRENVIAKNEDDLYDGVPLHTLCGTAFTRGQYTLLDNYDIDEQYKQKRDCREPQRRIKLDRSSDR